MPELVEVERYRRSAERVIGRQITTVDASDAWFCKGRTSPSELAAILPTLVVTSARRHGKLLMLDLQSPYRAQIARVLSRRTEPLRTAVCLGLRFGMTGRLLVGGDSAIDTLLYSSDRNDPLWDRFAMTFDDGTSLSIRDPRRLGGVELDPDTSLLGPDAADISLSELIKALSSSRSHLKAALLNQSRIAGIGNLIADELLWRAALSPQRSCDSLTAAELRVLAATIRSTIRLLQKRGGSHLGDLMDERVAGGLCPRDATVLRRESIGGRTSWWCPSHQR